MDTSPTQVSTRAAHERHVTPRLAAAPNLSYLRGAQDGHNGRPAHDLTREYLRGYIDGLDARREGYGPEAA